MRPQKKHSPLISEPYFAEDDILWVSEDLEAKIRRVISKLPEGWHLCYLGWHGQSVLHLAHGDMGCLEAAVELEDLFLGEAGHHEEFPEGLTLYQLMLA